jgi:hypothetical protein
MIERLATGLRRLASLPVHDLGDTAGTRLLGDCADAVRLELDCPQQALTAPQRLALAGLNDLLEQPDAPGAELIAAARRACFALGLPTSAPRDESPSARRTDADHHVQTRGRP